MAEIGYGTAGQVLKSNGAGVAPSWQTASSGGDASTNTSSSVDSELALFSGTGGKTLKRASGSGIAKLASGVLSVVTAPTGDLVGTSDAQTLTNKTLTSPIINLSSDANGDMYYRNSGVLVRLPKGTDGQVLTLASGLPSWATPSGGGSSYDESNPILDSSSNELLKFAKVSSAVNEITISNNSTGNSPIISASGGDTNISIIAQAKGSGGFISKSFVRATGEWNTNPTIFEAVSSSDGTTQKLKIFINGGDSKWINFQPASTGGLILEGFTTLGSNGLQNTAQTMAFTGDVGRVNFAIRAIASQTANLLDFRNSSDTVIAGFDKNAAWKPPSLANSAAPNNSVYYSTDASKLVYKDSGGTVNNLY